MQDSHTRQPRKRKRRRRYHPLAPYARKHVRSSRRIVEPDRAAYEDRTSGMTPASTQARLEPVRLGGSVTWQPTRGDHRLIAPLFNTGVTGDAPTRLAVGERVVLAQLGDDEATRVARATGELRSPSVRLEVHGFTRQPSDPFGIVQHYLRLLALVVRMSPRHHGVVIDCYDGQVWRRVGFQGAGYLTAGSTGKYSYLPASRLTDGWAALIDAWPVAGAARDKGIYRAVEAYHDSVTERRNTSSVKALLTSAVAFELLLGPGIHEQLRYRMSTRGALLVASGDDAHSISRWLRKYYDARSSLVHAGQEPSTEVVDQIHQYLMRALPAMLRLSQLTGSHKQAVETLDAAPYGRPPALDSILEDGWWSSVPSRWLADRLK